MLLNRNIRKQPLIRGSGPKVAIEHQRYLDACASFESEIDRQEAAQNRKKSLNLKLFKNGNTTDNTIEKPKFRVVDAYAKKKT